MKKGTTMKPGWWRMTLAGILVFTLAMISGTLRTTATEKQQEKAPVSAPPYPSPLDGKPAPLFELYSHGGGTQKISLASYRGKLVIVNFWASWCGPCTAEMPLLNHIYSKYKEKGLVILGINYQQGSEAVTSFLREHKIVFPILYDSDGSVLDAYKGPGLPTTYFVNEKGIVIGGHIGMLQEADINEWIYRLLGE